MAVTGFSIRLYGEVDESPQYLPNSQGNLPAVSATYGSAACLVANLPAAPVIAFPIAAPGAVMAGNTSCYGIIEIPPTGLNDNGRRYVVQETVAQIASLRNA